MKMEEIKKEWEQKLNEVRNNHDGKMSSEFGYKYFDAQCNEVYTITDFGNIWKFIEKVYKLGEENGIDNTKDEARKRIIGLLKRIKLEFDVCICDCGAEWKDTDGAELVNSMIEDLER